MSVLKIRGLDLDANDEQCAISDLLEKYGLQVEEDEGKKDIVTYWADIFYKERVKKSGESTMQFKTQILFFWVHRASQGKSSAFGLVPDMKAKDKQQKFTETAAFPEGLVKAIDDAIEIVPEECFKTVWDVFLKKKFCNDQGLLNKVREFLNPFVTFLKQWSENQLFQPCVDQIKEEWEAESLSGKVSLLQAQNGNEEDREFMKKVEYRRAIKRFIIQRIKEALYHTKEQIEMEKPKKEQKEICREDRPSEKKIEELHMETNGEWLKNFLRRTEMIDIVQALKVVLESDRLHALVCLHAPWATEEQLEKCAKELPEWHWLVYQVLNNCDDSNYQSYYDDQQTEKRRNYKLTEKRRNYTNTIDKYFEILKDAVEKQLEKQVQGPNLLLDKLKKLLDDVIGNPVMPLDFLDGAENAAKNDLVHEIAKNRVAVECSKWRTELEDVLKSPQTYINMLTPPVISQESRIEPLCDYFDLPLGPEELETLEELGSLFSAKNNDDDGHFDDGVNENPSSIAGVHLNPSNDIQVDENPRKKPRV